MTWQAALKFCIDNPGQCVWDRDNYAHIVSVDSGAPRLRSDVEVRPFDPKGEPYRAVKNPQEQ